MAFVIQPRSSEVFSGDLRLTREECELINFRRTFQRLIHDPVSGSFRFAREEHELINFRWRFQHLIYDPVSGDYKLTREEREFILTHRAWQRLIYDPEGYKREKQEIVRQGLARLAKQRR